MEKKSFFSSLFDLSFDSFVTTKIIKLIFLLLVAGSVIYGVIMLFGALATIGDAPFMGLLMLLATPFLTLLFIVGARVYCELIVVTFRIAENLKAILTLQKEQTKQGAVNIASSASAPSAILRK